MTSAFGGQRSIQLSYGCNRGRVYRRSRDMVQSRFSAQSALFAPVPDQPSGATAENRACWAISTAWVRL